RQWGGLFGMPGETEGAKALVCSAQQLVIAPRDTECARPEGLDVRCREGAFRLFDRIGLTDDGEGVEACGGSRQSKPCLPAEPVFVGEQLFEHIETTACERQTCARCDDRDPVAFDLEVVSAGFELGCAARVACELPRNCAQ